MTFLIAAAGTGGHVFPGLSVGEALVEQGVDRSRILYVGGERLEAEVFPKAGFPLVQVEPRGLRRSLDPANLGLPALVWRARTKIVEVIADQGVRAALGLGGYVTVPAALAARKTKIPFMISEQNAEAGLANRFSARWADRVFGSFPETRGLPSAEWVGNPVRRPFWDFQRSHLRPAALRRYGFTSELPVLGVFGGSLGAGIINEVVTDVLTRWQGPPLQVVHLTGTRNLEGLESLTPGPGVAWVRRGFEEKMEMFYAVSDLVVARAGGAVAELTATATPAILVPGSFGSAGHQGRNAEELARRGAAVVLPEERLTRLEAVVTETLFDPEALRAMAESARELGRPGAARTIAAAMRSVAR
ncbi:MAG TPA: UDP-N-acetylglucosamine--N-acetylmuramyl-(pentapeptide) pyrophosphoryl-undecaprenol N-acetylglucosamine transferase [Acidimicrobiia bacterium]|nr:UDP-N-acetylglucosamine--N-acetylmuramyl-(pentapeptide) pyrophosphoryl-undecaprenol N-acetylglucosamine transferase [Acidimicrobiia bacterium]